MIGGPGTPREVALDLSLKIGGAVVIVCWAGRRAALLEIIASPFAPLLLEKARRFLVEDPGPLRLPVDGGIRAEPVDVRRPGLIPYPRRMPQAQLQVNILRRDEERPAPAQLAQKPRPNREGAKGGPRDAPAAIPP